MNTPVSVISPTSHPGGVIQGRGKNILYVGESSGASLTISRWNE